MHGPRGSKPPMIELSSIERGELNTVLRRSTPQQPSLHARSVPATVDGFDNSQVARSLAVSCDMASLRRRRWVGLQAASLNDVSGEEHLTDMPRPGEPARISAHSMCQITALAREAPAESGRPISQWSSRGIANELQRRGIVRHITTPRSPPAQKGNLKPHLSHYWLTPPSDEREGGFKCSRYQEQLLRPSSLEYCSGLGLPLADPASMHKQPTQ